MNLFNKLLTAICTVLVSVSQTFCVLILRAIFNGNVYIDHLATHRAKVHWNVCAAVIKVRTTVFLPSHRLLLIRCLFVNFPQPMAITSNKKTTSGLAKTTRIFSSFLLAHSLSFFITVNRIARVNIMILNPHARYENP